MHCSALLLCTAHVHRLVLCGQHAMVDLQVNKLQQQCLQSIWECVYAACWKQAAALKSCSFLEQRLVPCPGSKPISRAYTSRLLLRSDPLGKLLGAQTVLALTAMAPAAGAGAAR